MNKLQSDSPSEERYEHEGRTFVITDLTQWEGARPAALARYRRKLEETYGPYVFELAQVDAASGNQEIIDTYVSVESAKRAIKLICEHE